ncbi:MAG TPA: biopolymer transporter ExbD, partial [Kofleriaceae bacterium]|nr:biopolymer transporter ExbD [Kofleriaceae bacterium]
APMTEDPQGKLILNIDRNGNLSLGRSPVKWADLEQTLLANDRVQREKTLWIGADKTLHYDVVVTAMAKARAAHVSKLMMLTDRNAEIDVGALDKAAGPRLPVPDEGGGGEAPPP